MTAEILRIAGQVAGIGGLALGVFLLLFRDIVRKKVFPTLTKEQGYRLLRMIALLVWALALVGIGAWVLVSLAPHWFSSRAVNAQDSTLARNPYLAKLQTSGDLVEFLETSVRELESISGTDYNQILLATTSAYSRELVSVADAVPEHKQRYRMATFDGLLGLAFSTGKTVTVKDVNEHPEYFTAVTETKSELVVPIRNGSVVLGVLNSESDTVQHFDYSIVANAESLAAAIAELLPRYGWTAKMPEEKAPWIRRFPRQAVHNKAVHPSGGLGGIRMEGHLAAAG